MGTRRANGEGSIGQRKDGKWYGAIRLPGEAKQRFVYGDTRKEVVEKLAALRAKHQQGERLDASKVTVGQFMARWLEEVVSRKRPRTAASYRQLAETHIIPAIGSVPLSALRGDTVQALINRLADRGLAANTVRNVRAVLRAALNTAVKWRYISFNPAGPVDLPHKEAKPPAPFTVDEAKTFLATVKGNELEPLYALALLLGLRQGELLGLQVSSFDFAAGTLRIDGALTRIDGQWLRQPTKTRASVRTLPIPPQAAAVVKAHIEGQKEKGYSYAFTALSGGPVPLTPNTLIPHFKAVLKRAGLPVRNFHMLRHSAATFLLAAGEGPRTVQEILGHSTMATTMQIYAHVLDETRRGAVAAIGGLLTGE